jgi:hypothetical protein
MREAFLDLPQQSFGVCLAGHGVTLPVANTTQCHCNSNLEEVIASTKKMEGLQ